MKEQRSELERCIITQAAEGFKIGVCDDFIERIEKTVYVGEVPENKLSLTKIDNTVNNIVEGFVRDVTYELGLPLVVKQKKVEKPTAEDDDDDDDLKIVGYTEATIKPVAIREVKRGATITTSQRRQRIQQRRKCVHLKNMERCGKKSLRSRKPRHRPVELL